VKVMPSGICPKPVTVFSAPSPQVDREMTNTTATARKNRVSATLTVSTRSTVL